MLLSLDELPEGKGFCDKNPSMGDASYAGGGGPLFLTWNFFQSMSPSELITFLRPRMMGTHIGRTRVNVVLVRDMICFFSARVIFPLLNHISIIWKYQKAATSCISDGIKRRSVLWKEFKVIQYLQPRTLPSSLSNCSKICCPQLYGSLTKVVYSAFSSSRWLVTKRTTSKNVLYAETENSCWNKGILSAGWFPRDSSGAYRITSLLWVLWSLWSDMVRLSWVGVAVSQDLTVTWREPPVKQRYTSRHAFKK